jgi:hypothetical protein
MNTDIKIQLLTLADGQKLLRVEDDTTGLGLERKLASGAPLIAQKAKLMRLFQELLASDTSAA